MASGRINLSVTSTNYITGYIDWSESDIDVEHNTSKVSATLTYVSGGSQNTGWSSSNFHLTINGTTFNYTGALYINAGQTVSVPFSSTPQATVTHNSDGSKSITIEGGGYITSTSGLSASSGTGTAVLDVIPRGSTFGTIVGSSIGLAITININKKADFWHKVTYSFVNATGTAGTTNSTASSISWTPAYSTFGNQIPNSTSAVCTLTLTTYSDSARTVQVGDAVTTQITLSLPSNVLPTITKPTIAETNSANQTGAYIQIVSQPQFTATTGGIYGSTIASVTFNFDSIQLPATLSGTTATGTFPSISSSGSLIATATVTDSRGRSRTSQPLSVSVLAYSKPVLSSCSAKRRSSAQGTIRSIITASVSSVTVNSAEANEMKCYAIYAVKGTTIPAPDQSYQITTSGLSATSEYKDTVLSETTSYVFRIMVADKFFQTYRDIAVGTAGVILDINEDGYLGVGKYREHGALDVNGEIYGSSALSVGGKLAYNDGVRGIRMASGQVFMEGGSGTQPSIFFFGGNGATAYTAAIRELIDGFLTIRNNATTFAINAPSDSSASKIVMLPFYNPAHVGWTGATGFPDGYLEKWVQTACAEFPDLQNTLFIGSAQSGSRAIIFWFCYDTSTNSSGMPEYSTGLLIPISSSTNLKRFGTNSYTLWSAEVGGGSTYTNADDVSF